MSEFKIHNSFEEAIEQFKAENPDCKITVFSGNPQDIINGLELKEYPLPIDTSIPKYLIKIGKEEHILSLWKCVQKGFFVEKWAERPRFRSLRSRYLGGLLDGDQIIPNSPVS